MIRGVATLDQGRKAVTVMSGSTWEGTWSGIYGTKTVRSTAVALAAIARDGWEAAPGAKWEISPADNGHVIDVIKVS